MSKLRPPAGDPSMQAPDDATRKAMEQSAFNYWMSTGHKVRMPPTLFDSLKEAGVDTKYMEADASLEQ
jgi:hypothetical protein